MSSRYEYKVDPATAELPLRQDEVEALILNGGKVLSRNDAALSHFLRRVGATLRDHRNRMAGLQKDVSKIRGEKEMHSHPMAKAMEALAALDDEQKRQLLDAGYLAEVDKLQRAQEEAQLAKTAAINESNRLRFKISALLGDETIPASVRQRIANAVTEMKINIPSE